MPSVLRPIALTVEESTPGLFTWRLLEHVEGSWAPLDAARRPLKSYAQSMSAGLLALQALVDDLDAGPRAEEPAAPVPVRVNALARPFGFGTLK